MKNQCKIDILLMPQKSKPTDVFKVMVIMIKFHTFIDRVFQDACMTQERSRSNCVEGQADLVICWFSCEMSY